MTGNSIHCSKFEVQGTNFEFWDELNKKRQKEELNRKISGKDLRNSCEEQKSEVNQNPCLSPLKNRNFQYLNRAIHLLPSYLISENRILTSLTQPGTLEFSHKHFISEFVFFYPLRT